MNLLDLKREIATIEGELSSNDYLKSRPDLVASANKRLDDFKAELLKTEGGGSRKLPEALKLPEAREIVNSTKLKKHQKIYLLSTMGLDNKEIASQLQTNAGHVWNALNDYKKNPAKVKEAEAIKP
jgi:hypothetical protein